MHARQRRLLSLLKVVGDIVTNRDLTKGFSILFLVGMDFNINELLILINDERWDFWESRTLEELARAQNVKPIADVRALFGTWPGEINDGFEAAIEELRHSDTKIDGKS